MAARPEVPGEPTTTGTTLLETATAAIQGFDNLQFSDHKSQVRYSWYDYFSLISSIDVMVFVCSCRFHDFHAQDMARQAEANHFCGHQNEEMSDI